MDMEPSRFSRRDLSSRYPITTEDGRTIIRHEFRGNQIIPIYASTIPFALESVPDEASCTTAMDTGEMDVRFLQSVNRSMHSKSIGMKLLIIILGIILIMSIMSILGTLLWNSNVILKLVINGSTVVVLGGLIAYLLGMRVWR